jgi:hypothetical protein
MDGDNLFVGMRNMEDMIKMQWVGGCGNNRLANMINIHTCTIRCPNLIIAIVAVMHGQFL